MKLNETGLREPEEWIRAGYHLPEFERAAVTKRTKCKPGWVHFGVGNIFRAFPANIAQSLLNKGTLDSGLIAIEGYDYEIVHKMTAPHDNLSILVTLKHDGTIEKTVIGSVVESLTLDRDNQSDFNRIREIFANPSLQMVSFTITEKGYCLVDGEGVFLRNVAQDFQRGPQKAESYIGKIAALLYIRYQAGQLPVSMVSMDNCSHNGTLLKNAIETVAQMWFKNNLIDAEFLCYLNNPDMVAFPWTMIDKITPHPDPSVEAYLKQDGIEGLEITVTSKHTHIAPYVNAEEHGYLVIEDWFPNGRPNLDEGGIIFSDRDTVDRVEKMKVCTCLNPLHTALAVFGCLLGYQLISKEMDDKTLKKLIWGVGYKEGLPVVTDPIIIHPIEFLDTVVNERIPNPFMPDTPQRIATDTSQKLAIRFGETIKAYQKSEKLRVSDLKSIPLVLAGWIRYLMAIDDQGKSYEVSPDPLYEIISKYTDHLTMGMEEDIKKYLEPLLSDEKIFGVNLMEIELGEKVCKYVKEMIRGKGAVRKTLEKYLD